MYKIIFDYSTSKYEVLKQKSNSWVTVSKNSTYKDAVQSYISLANPIKSNRLVSDETFALRLLNFLKNIQPLDCASYEEKEYLTLVAKQLLDFQKISNFISDINEIIINRARQGKTFCTLEIPLDLNSNINNVIENLEKRNFKIENFNQVLLIFWDNKK